jgi:hypothetical protein
MRARKPRSDAWHAGLSVAQQDRAFEWCNKLGQKQAAAMIAQEFGLSRPPSDTALSRWWSDWPLRKAWLNIGDVASQAKSMLIESPDLKLDVGQIEAVGQAMFAAAAVKLQDADLFTSMRKLGQKDAELALDRQRFQRDTCSLFLQWSEDKRAREIAAGTGSQAEKIETLGRAMFGDTWEAGQ